MSEIEIEILKSEQELIEELMLREPTSSQTIAKPNVMRRYVIMGVEFDNLWKPIELFVGENGILLTTDDFNDAAKYVNLESAEYVIEYLNNNYSDYSWHVVVSINGA